MNSLKAAQNFAKKTVAKGKKSKLDPHSDAIKFLLENDYTLLQIQDFLKSEIKLSVSYSNLQGWVKRRFKNESKASSNQKDFHYEQDQGSNEALTLEEDDDGNNKKKRGKRYTSSPSTRERRANYSLESNNTKDENEQHQ